MKFTLGDMVPDGLGRRPCWRKERWASKGAAEAQMRSLLARDKSKDPGRINAYECPYCKQWHVGHKKIYDTDKETT